MTCDWVAAVSAVATAAVVLVASEPVLVAVLLPVLAPTVAVAVVLPLVVSVLAVQERVRAVQLLLQQGLQGAHQRQHPPALKQLDLGPPALAQFPLRFVCRDQHRR